jgi:hypothetical protein
VNLPLKELSNILNNQKTKVKLEANHKSRLLSSKAELTELIDQLTRELDDSYENFKDTVLSEIAKKSEKHSLKFEEFEVLETKLKLQNVVREITSSLRNHSGNFKNELKGLSADLLEVLEECLKTGLYIADAKSLMDCRTRALDLIKKLKIKDADLNDALEKMNAINWMNSAVGLINDEDTKTNQFEKMSKQAPKFVESLNEDVRDQVVQDSGRQKGRDSSQQIRRGK